MTERIYQKDNMFYKLTCRLSLNTFGYAMSYGFKLMKREKGKRKWQEVDPKNRYCIYTEIEEILKVLSIDDMMALAEEEHKKYAPRPEVFNI